MTKARLLLAAVFLSLSTGCAHHFDAQVVPGFDSITEFRTHGAVTLINGQPSKDEHTFLNAGIHTYNTNLNACTQTAIKTAQRELAQRGAQVDNGFGKSITLSITGVKFDVGWVRIDSFASLHAQTSSGYAETYYGKDFAVMAGNVQNQLDGAVSAAVAQMLNDPKIVAFLND